jgi:transcriptional regulator with XRE-family HTH domain
MVRRGGQGAETAGKAFGELVRIKREDIGMTQDDLADQLHVERSYVTKIENGERVPGEELVAQMDRVLFGRGELIKLHRRINWEARLQYFPDWFKKRAVLDENLIELYEYQTQLIPGLLQTEDYARALFERVVGTSTEEIDESTLARISRQTRFLEPEGPLYVALLDESCIHHRVGTAGGMRAQLDHLLRVGELPNVCIQILPFSRANVETPNADLSLITLPSGRRWSYSETLTSAEFSNNVMVIAGHQRLYDLLRADALSASESAALIREAREGHGHHEQQRSDFCPLAQEQLQRQQRRKLHRSSPRIHHWRRPAPRQQGPAWPGPTPHRCGLRVLRHCRQVRRRRLRPGRAVPRGLIRD